MRYLLPITYYLLPITYYILAVEFWGFFNLNGKGEFW
jgi:hypothetical protein